MQEVLSKLEQVQEVDVKINAILSRKAEFPKRLETFQNEIKTNRDKFEEKKKIVDELDRSRKQQLGALELNEERSKRSQEKLEQIKTNQEFQALQKEIESLKKNSGVIKENADKVTVEYDKFKKEMDLFDAAMKDAQTKYDTEAAKISEETKGMDQELAKLNELRKQAIVGIDSRYLATYDRVRGTRGGIGIVYAIGGSCKGCNMRIPPQIYNELQRGTEMHICPSCRRILVFKDAIRSAQPSASG